MCEEGLAINQILITGKEIEQGEDTKTAGECCFQSSCSFKIGKPQEGWGGVVQRESELRNGSEEEKLEKTARTEESLEPVPSGGEGLFRYH